MGSSGRTKFPGADYLKSDTTIWALIILVTRTPDKLYQPRPDTTAILFPIDSPRREAAHKNLSAIVPHNNPPLE